MAAMHIAPAEPVPIAAVFVPQDQPIRARTHVLQLRWFEHELRILEHRERALSSARREPEDEARGVAGQRTRDRRSVGEEQMHRLRLIQMISEARASLTAKLRGQHLAPRSTARVAQRVLLVILAGVPERREMRGVSNAVLRVLLLDGIPIVRAPFRAPAARHLDRNAPAECGPLLRGFEFTARAGRLVSFGACVSHHFVSHHLNPRSGIIRARALLFTGITESGVMQPSSRRRRS